VIDVRCRPIDNWSGARTRAHDRRSSPFSAGFQRIRIDLTRELVQLDADDVVIGLDVRPDQIRLDGWPKAGVNPPPPVILTFESKVGPLRFQCDRYARWEDNLRAIGLTLQRLRLVDEGGVARSGEQYQGWNALPPGQPIAVGAAMTVEDAARLLAFEGLEELDAWPDVMDAPEHAYRLAAKRHHPDAGGDPELFRRLVDAKRLIEERR